MSHKTNTECCRMKKISFLRLTILDWWIFALPFKAKIISSLAYNFAPMEIFINWSKEKNLFHSQKLNFCFLRYYRVWVRSTLEKSCLEIWSLRIYCLTKMEMSKLLILDYQNLKLMNKILLFLIVVVHNIWRLKCLRSIC